MFQFGCGINLLVGEGESVKTCPKAETQPKAEGQVFTDPPKLSWQVYQSCFNLWEGFSWPALNNVALMVFPDLLSAKFGRLHWPVIVFLTYSQKCLEDFTDLWCLSYIYQWNMLLRGQLAQVSEILQTLWRPGRAAMLKYSSQLIERNQGFYLNYSFYVIVWSAP